MSDESGEARCAFRADGVYVPTKMRGKLKEVSDMARLRLCQTTGCRLIYEVLNKYFGAKNKAGNPLEGFGASVWPRSAPFLAKSNDKRAQGTVVWFPKMTDDHNSRPRNGWQNLVSNRGKTITTTYVGPRARSEVENVASRFADNDHIVFVKSETTGELEFFGVFSCSKKGNVRTYTRKSDEINTADWQRR